MEMEGGYPSIYMSWARLILYPSNWVHTALSSAPSVHLNFLLKIGHMDNLNLILSVRGLQLTSYTLKNNLVFLKNL